MYNETQERNGRQPTCFRERIVVLCRGNRRACSLAAAACADRLHIQDASTMHHFSWMCADLGALAQRVRGLPALRLRAAVAPTRPVTVLRARARVVRIGLVRCRRSCSGATFALSD